MQSKEIHKGVRTELFTGELSTCPSQADKYLQIDGVRRESFHGNLPSLQQSWASDIV